MRPLTIPRIQAPTLEVFRKRYVERYQPAILEGMFAGEEIWQLRTPERVMARFGQVRMVVEQDPLQQRGPQPTSQVKTLRSYLAEICERPNPSHFIQEQDVPAEVLGSFGPPRYLELNAGAVQATNLQQVFCGPPGAKSHLHIDGDLRHVIQYTLFGQKRVVLIPPSASMRFPSRGNFAGIYMNRLTEGERRAFLEYVGGAEVVLKAREALYMPPGIWHYFHYEKPALSISFRFGRANLHSFLHALHPCLHRLGIQARLLERDALVRFRDEIQLLLDRYFRDYRSPKSKFLVMADALEKVYQRICESASAPRFMGVSDVDYHLITRGEETAQRYADERMRELRRVLLPKIRRDVRTASQEGGRRARA